MKFKIEINITEPIQKVQLHEHVVLLGSCFSDSMSKHFAENGINVYSNPFGTIFHPSAICEAIKRSIENEPNIESLKRSDIYLDWLCGSTVYSTTEAGLHKEILQKRKKLRKLIEGPSTLILTFGTAWGYRHKAFNRIVGNCHKQPASLFEKELTDLDTMLGEWRELIQLLKFVNPELKIILTVSPVRHIRDGVIENNRSKARLIELTHRLIEEFELIYFPSYEILIDELRDYRFYCEDLTHPSDEAIKYVWDRFKKFGYSDEDVNILDAVGKVKREMKHRPIHAESAAEKERLTLLEKRITALREQFPFLLI